MGTGFKVERVGAAAIAASAMEGIVFLTTFLLAIIFTISMLLFLVGFVGTFAVLPVLWIDSGILWPPRNPCCSGSIVVDLASLLDKAEVTTAMLAFMVTLGMTIGIVGRIRSSGMGRVKIVLCAAFSIFFIVDLILSLMDSSGGVWYFLGTILVVALKPALFVMGEVSESPIFKYIIQYVKESDVYGSMVVNESNMVELIFGWFAICLILLVTARMIAAASAFVFGLVGSDLYRRHIVFSFLATRERRGGRWFPPAKSLLFIAAPFAKRLATIYAVAISVSLVLYFILKNKYFNLFEILGGLGRRLSLSPTMSIFVLGYVPITTIVAISFIRSRKSADSRLATELLILCLAYPFVAKLLNSDAAYVWFIAGFPVALLVLASRRWLWLGMRESWNRLQAARQRDVSYERFLATRPIMYLRAFMDDRKSLSARMDPLNLVMGVRSVGQRFEEVIAERAFNWRPIVALGNPHLPFQLHGVLKRETIRSGDPLWLSEVERLSDASAYTIMIGNTTEGIMEELKLLHRTDRIRKTIFVITDPALGRAFFKHYDLIGLSEDMPLRSLIVYHDHGYGWTAITSIIRTYSAYSIALDVALARMEQQQAKAA